MRKLFFVIPLALMMCACGGTKADAEGENTETTEVATADDNGITAQLDEYQQVCEQLVDLTKKVKGGETGSASELMNVSKKMQDLSMDLAKKTTDMTADQMKRFQEIAEKMGKEMEALK